MEDVILKRIDKHSPKLLDCMTVDEKLLHTLVAYNVLQNHHMKDIRVLKPTERVSEILSIVRANTGLLPNLCRGLKETKQEEAYLLLATTGSVAGSKADTTSASLSSDETDSALPSTEQQFAAGLEKLKMEYIRLYREVPSFFSNKKIDMEQHYVEREVTEISKEANRVNSGVRVDEAHLFEKGNQALIIGKAGSGKTALARKYAYQWAVKQSENFVNNLPLVIVCTVPSIDEHIQICESDRIDKSIEKFLSRFDSSNSLYRHYVENKERCLVIFEAMNEASESSQLCVREYLQRYKQQPVLITARSDDCLDLPASVRQLCQEAFTKEQALKYFRDAFLIQEEEARKYSKDPFQIELEVKNLLTSETIDTKLLETPYNCQGLGELLMQDIGEETINYRDGLKLTATVLVRQQIAHLQKMQRTVSKSFLENCANLALYGTIIDEKQPFKEADLKKFKIKDCSELENFMTKRLYRGENTFIFQHQLRKDYLAALAVTKLDPERRDQFYKLLSSRRKYVAVVRFICGLLDMNRSTVREEFRNIIGHMKLLGDTKHLQSKVKDRVLEISTRTVNSTLKELCGDTSSDLYTLSPEEAESLAIYKEESESFTDGKLSEAEKLSFLDGDNGRSCFSWRTLELFEDIYTCLSELPISKDEKQEYDIMKRLLCLEKDDPIQGKMYAFPVEDSERWGHMLLKESIDGGELWILTHTVEDAIEGLEGQVPDEFDPSVVGICIPSAHARTLWGIPEEEDLNLGYLCESYMKRNLRTFLVWLETPLQLMDALPTEGLENVKMTLFPYDVNCLETWQEFLDYVSPLCIGGVEVCYATANLMADGYLTALTQAKMGEIRVKEFRVLDASIKMKEALRFKQALQQKGIKFQFDRTEVYDIESIHDVICIMNDDFVIAAPLKLKDPKVKLECSADEWNKAIAAKWSNTELTSDTLELYNKVLNKAPLLDANVYELPSCYQKENTKHMKTLLRTALSRFHRKGKANMSVAIKTNIIEVTELIAAAAESKSFRVQWSMYEDEEIYIAELSHK